MTRIRYSTREWKRHDVAWPCFLCSDNMPSDVCHLGTPYYAAQSMPSGIWLYACRVLETLPYEVAMRVGDEWLDRQLSQRTNGNRPKALCEMVIEREPHLKERRSTQEEVEERIGPRWRPGWAR